MALVTAEGNYRSNRSTTLPVKIPAQWLSNYARVQPRPQAPVSAWGLQRAALKEPEGFLPFPALACFSRAGDEAGTRV
jgi:hypothetical protein